MIQSIRFKSDSDLKQEELKKEVEEVKEVGGWKCSIALVFFVYNHNEIIQGLFKRGEVLNY